MATELSVWPEYMSVIVHCLYKVWHRELIMASVWWHHSLLHINNQFAIPHNVFLMHTVNGVAGSDGVLCTLAGHDLHLLGGIVN